MPRRLKIDIDFSQDNTLIGISCHKKDYWVAYKLNENLHLNLKRIDDLPVYNSKLDLLISYTLFNYNNPDTHNCYYFISNYNPEGNMFPSLKSIDYFLLINGLINESEVSGMVSAIKKIPNILIAFKHDLNKINDSDGFLSDLELHILEKIELKK